MRLTRRYRFSASHRLHNPALSDDANRALYGKCNNPWGHGHDYVLEVSVSGPVNPQTGQVVNLNALDRLVNQTVIEKLDHRDLNGDAFPPGGPVPTSENLVREVERRLLEAWPVSFSDPRPVLAGIRLRETKRNSFETVR